ncbi:MAG: Fe-S cluster assembly protein SufD [Crocinitomicaceae bacterium]|nr:Fe-S cluster assembly protein SufD [Crocinitomicaceae bacterium]
MEAVANSKVSAFVENWSLPAGNETLRAEALQALKGMDFPTTRVEDWKYTRITRITNKTFHQSAMTLDVKPYIIPNLEAHVLVFVNGYFQKNLSTILEGDVITIADVNDLDNSYYTNVLEDVDENVFSLMNKAFATAGVYLTIPKNQKAAYPIHLLHVSTGERTVANVRHFIQAETGSKAEVFATFHSEGANDALVNVVFEGHIQENAKLTINKLQSEEQSTFHIANEIFVQDPSSNFEINTITIGGLLVRNGLNILVEGENCYTELNGVYLGKGKQLLDNHTFVDHLFGNCTSSETYKGVMDDQSIGVFNGKVVVRQDAQKIQAYQSNGNVLLSEQATVNSKPELEIYADDVRCSHGSTTGQLDEQAVFYLRARGLSEKKAKELLVSAFIGEVLEKVDNATYRAYVDELFWQKFGWQF